MELNTQPFLFIASGLLSQATGPNGVGFAKPPTTGGGQPDQPPILRRIRLQNVRAVFGGQGEVQIYDTAGTVPAPEDEIWSSISNGANGVDDQGLTGLVCNSGDVYVKITGAAKVYLYVDKNF